MRTAILILVAAVGLAYSNSFQGEFIFDDFLSTIENEAIQDLSTVGSAIYPERSKGDTVEGRPVLALTLALNYAFTGEEVWSYHVVNLLIHLAACMTLFGLVRRTLLLPKLREAYGPRSTWLAMAVALIWGLHPLQTESVTYIIQRAESLVSLFYLLTFYCVARANLSERPGRWLGLAILSCTTGMAAKEVMVTAPLMVLLYERVFVFDAWRDLFRRRWQFYLLLAATWLVLVACMAPLGGRGGTAGIGHGVSSWHYLMTQADGIATYLRLAVWPDVLILDYGKYLITDLSEVLAEGVLIVILLAATLWALWRRPPVGFLGAWFFIILSPTSSFVPIVTQTVAEHRVYLALASLVMLFVLLVDYAWRRFTSRLSEQDRGGILIRRGPAMALILLAAMLGYRTWLRNFDYQSTVSIWHTTVLQRPDNTRAIFSLAMGLSDIGESETAVRLFDEFIARKPLDGGAYYQRGRTLLEMNDLSGAFADLSRSIELKPEAGAYQNRGLIYCRLGEFEKAIPDFDQALALDPELQIAYRNRALAHYALKQYDQSRHDIARFRELGGTPDDELARIESILQRR